jgi:hypothetical protein
MRRFFYDTEFMEEPGFLELLSIGVVGVDGREFYAEVADAPVERANPWVCKHVLPHLGKPGVHRWTKAAIRHHLERFLAPTPDDPVELWGYFADFDHVLLAWLWGAMVAMPPGMPMLTLDVKQLALERPGVVLPPMVQGMTHNALWDARWVRDAYFWLMGGAR